MKIIFIDLYNGFKWCNGSFPFVLSSECVWLGLFVMNGRIFRFNFIFLINIFISDLLRFLLHDFRAHVFWLIFV